MSPDPIVVHPEFDRTAERLSGFAWGASAGQPLPAALAPAGQAVGSAIEARALLESDAWEAWSLKLHGALTEYLDRVHHRRYQDWRQISGKAKTVLTRLEPAIADGLNECGMPGNVPLDTVRWDVVAALVCAGFMDCSPPTDVLKLLDVYEAGHLPVGWNAERQRLLIY